MSSDRRRAIFFNKYRFMIWHILISESVSVYGRYAVGLLSVWVRDCRSAVGYDSSIVLMVGFHSVSCRLSIGLKSGDPIPNLTRSDPGWFYGVFSNIVGGRQLADSLKILRFCRFRVGLAGVTGVLNHVSKSGYKHRHSRKAMHYTMCLIPVWWCIILFKRMFWMIHNKIYPIL